MKSTLTILLASFLVNANLFAQVSAPSIETSFQNYLRAESGRVYTGGALPVFSATENTIGNRYLFEKWVKGTITGADGTFYNDSTVSFNYDKMGQKLLMLVTHSNKMIELNSGDIAGFSLKENDSEYHFERIKNSTDLRFFEPVYKSEKGYSLYKLLTTTFKKADYQTNGITESGNKYSQYIDEVQYFILTPKQELVKVAFKKKNIEKVLDQNSSEVKSFFAQHKNDVLNEAFLRQLLQFLNSKS